MIIYSPHSDRRVGGGVRGADGERLDVVGHVRRTARRAVRVYYTWKK